MASQIDLDLAHSYTCNPSKDSDYALLPLKMSFRAGGAYALLGPSGCGKTTMLNIISGLVRPSQGSVKFNDKDVTDLSPQERNIAQVFQFPVLYDTMTVAENLAFPLRNRGMDSAYIKRRVGEVAEMLELESQLDHRASGLSADAKQKISLGRGLVRPDVAAILFDEPLTVIDPHLKWQLRRKLKQIHQELQLTLIYVTHDQVEALTFAQEVVVMTHGRAVQMGSAEDLFQRPAHTFVGHFIGSPGMNFLPIAKINALNQNSVTLEIGKNSLLLDESQSALFIRALENPAYNSSSNHSLCIGVRPEYVGVGIEHLTNSLPAKVVRWQDLGTSYLMTAVLEDQKGTIKIHARLALDQRVRAVGETVRLNVLGPQTCFYKDEELLV